MNVILFDDESWFNLLPLTYTRPVSEVRIGIYTIREKWNIRLGTECSQLTQDYLSEKYPVTVTHQNLMVNSSVLPDKDLVEAIQKLKEKQMLVWSGVRIAAQVSSDQVNAFGEGRYTPPEVVRYKGSVIRLANTWDIFRHNGIALDMDFRLVGAGRSSASLSSTVTQVGKNIFVEEGAKVEYVHLNSSTGPIYIGKNSEIMEGSFIRGPFALLDDAVVKMGTHIYGPTTIGPACKVGGEINNVVFFANSNKAHDGFLGNAVVGEWVNIGAGTNASNLKNTYEEVKAWNEPQAKFVSTGLQFCGLVMADHSKCGINTMFNTASVVGVCCNIFGSGFPRTIIPSFLWGGPQGFSVFQMDKAIAMIERVMERRQQQLTETDRKILHVIYDKTSIRRLS